MTTKNKTEIEIPSVGYGGLLSWTYEGGELIATFTPWQDIVDSASYKEAIAEINNTPGWSIRVDADLSLFIAAPSVLVPEQLRDVISQVLQHGGIELEPYLVDFKRDMEAPCQG